MPIGLLAAMGTPYAKKPIFRSKKFKILCFLLVPIVVVIVVILLVFPIVRAIGRHTLHTSIIHLHHGNITAPTDAGFDLTLEGQATKLGIFPAQAYFRKVVDVYWINPDNMSEVHLGHMPVAKLGVAAGHAKINQLTHLTIVDLPGFGRFAEHLITQDSFTWRLKSEVDIAAFSFLAVNRLPFLKDLTVPGIANLTNLGIEDFQIPGNDPAGGVTVATVARATNPSPLGIETGLLGVNLFYKGLFLG